MEQLSLANNKPQQNVGRNDSSNLYPEYESPSQVMKRIATTFGVRTLLAFPVRSPYRLGIKHAGSPSRSFSITTTRGQQPATAATLIQSDVAAASKDNAALTPPPPKGRLSIVFTDIVKSTAIWESNAAAMTRAMQIHDSVVRKTAARHHGYEVKQNGDGFMIAFSTAVCAIQFCLSVQQQLINTSWPPELLKLQPGRVSKDDDGNVLFRGLRLRMSAHWGDPVCAWNDVIGRMDYLGPMVNRAARFIEVTEGGQIVVSEEFLQELQKARAEKASAAGANESKPVHQSKVEAGDTQLPLPDSEGELEAAVNLEGLQYPEHEGQQDPSEQHFEVRPLGKHQFKGITEPERLYFIIPRSLRGRLEHWPKHYHVPGSKGNLVPSSG